MAATKMKLAVEVRILKASVLVQEPQEIYVKWNRGKQSVDTKKLSVDEQIRVVEFSRSQANFAMSASFLQNPDGSLLPDMNKFQLYCGQQLVGTCTFDMSKYKGNTPVVERCTITAEGEGQTCLVGDPVTYPDAFIEFRVSLMEKGSAEEAKTQASLNRRSTITSSNSRARMSTLVPIQEASAAQEDPAQILSLNLRISELVSNMNKLELQNKTLVQQSKQDRQAAEQLEAQVTGLQEENERLKQAKSELEEEKHAKSGADEAEDQAQGLAIQALGTQVEELQAQNQELQELQRGKLAAVSQDAATSTLGQSADAELQSRIKALEEENEALKAAEKQQWVNIAVIESYLSEGYETVDWSSMSQIINQAKNQQ